MSTVCTKSNASSKTWTPLPDHFIDDHLVECSHSSIRRDFSWSTSRIWLRYTRSCSFPQIWWLTGLTSGLLAGHRAGVMKSGVSWVNRCTVSRAVWAGRLSAWLQYVTLCFAILLLIRVIVRILDLFQLLLFCPVFQRDLLLEFGSVLQSIWSLEFLSNQCGFRPTGSTTAALVHLFHSVTGMLETCSYVELFW